MIDNAIDFKTKYSFRPEEDDSPSFYVMREPKEQHNYMTFFPSTTFISLYPKTGIIPTYKSYIEELALEFEIRKHELTDGELQAIESPEFTKYLSLDESEL